MENETIDWETMTHLTNGCGGTVYESEIHKDGERVWWCMNCNRRISIKDVDDE